MDLINLDMAFASVSAVAAGIVFGFAGFGSGYVLIPLFSLIFGAREAIAVVMIMATLGGVSMMFNAARHVVWRQIGPMSILAVLTTPVGSVILLTVAPELMRRAIGAVILVLAVAMLMGIAYRGPRNMMTAAVAGVVSGLASGSVGLGGLAASLYILSSEESAAVQRAGMVVISALGTAVSAIVLTVTGIVDSTVIARALILMIPFGMTVWCGARVFKATPGPMFRRIVLAFVIALGVITLIV